jgi:tetratricopeptide (TPR) repeat protein
VNREYADKAVLPAVILIIWAGFVFLAAHAGHWRLWGINHLAYLPAPWQWYFSGAAVLAVIWTLTAGRRLVPLSDLAGRISAVLRGWRGGVLIALAVGVLGWLLHARLALLGDGIMRAEDTVRIQTPMPSELLPSALSMALARHLPEPWGFDGYDVLCLMSVFAGIVLVLGLWWLAPKARIERPRLMLFWFLTFGAGRLFAGYIETYALAIAVVGLLTVAALAYLRSNSGAAPVIVLWCLAVSSHVLAIVITPAVLLALGWGGRSRGINWRPLAIFAVIAVALTAYLGFRIQALQVHGEGSGIGQFLLPLVPQPPHQYGILSGAHVLDLINHVMLLAPAMIVAGIIWILKGRNRRASNGETPLNDPGARTERDFWLLAAGLPIIVAFIFDPKLGWARDWDLFTLFFTPALIGGAIWLSRLRSVATRRAAGSAAVLSLSLWLALSVNADAGISRFKALLDLDQSRADYGYEILALHYRAQGQTYDEIAHFQMALGITDNPRYRVSIAAANLRLERWEDAIRWYRDVLARDSTYEVAIHGMAYALERAGRFTEALPYAEKAVVLQPDDPARQFTLGIIQMALNDPQAAFPHLELATRARPDEPMHLTYLAACYLDLGQLHKAQATIDRARQIEPSLPLVDLLAARLALISGDFRQSRAYLDAYEQQVPRNERPPAARAIADSLRRVDAASE